MKQNEVNIAGVGIFHGDIDADIVKCAGVGRSLGNINCRRMEVAGVFSAGGKIKAEEVEVKGLLRSKADFSTERFTVLGAVMIDGLLNADNIDIKFDRIGRIREVGGDTVSIRPIYNYKGSVSRVFDNFMNMFANRRFKIDSIEGNEIYLENVDVNSVRGENVVVGPNCHVGFLEYSKKAKVHDSAQVGEMKGLKTGTTGEYSHE